MQKRWTMTAAALVAGAMVISIPAQGQRGMTEAELERRLEQLEARAERVENRGERRAERADDRGRDRAAERFERQSERRVERIEARMDRVEDRLDRMEAWAARTGPAASFGYNSGFGDDEDIIVEDDGAVFDWSEIRDGRRRGTISPTADGRGFEFRFD